MTPKLTITDTSIVPASTIVVDNEKELDAVIASATPVAADLPATYTRNALSPTASTNPSKEALLLSTTNKQPSQHNSLAEAKESGQSQFSDRRVPSECVAQATTCEIIASKGVWWDNYSMHHSDIESLFSERYVFVFKCI